MQYQLFLIPLIVLFTNQIIKLLVEMAKGELSWPKLFGYGGMPSSHSALVASLLIVIGYYQGINSPEFAIAVVLAAITIRDASGIRFKLGVHGQVINQLIKDLPDKKEYKYPVLQERLGHTTGQVIVGVITSAIISSLLIWIWPS